jgi:hypothetical protein
MTTVVTTASAADFLAVVPHLVGFEPQNSVVFVAFHGRRTCGAMRFDLPDVVESGADDSGSKLYKRVATTLVGMLSKLPGVDAVVPVVYTAETFADSGGAPRAAFARAVVARFEFSGFELRDALCVAADGWGSYFDDKCPPTGRPLADIVGSAILDDVPASELPPLGQIERWAALPEVTATERARVARSVRVYSTAIDGRLLSAAGFPLGDDDDDGDEPADAQSRLLAEVPAVLERILDHGAIDIEADAAGFVITLARLPALRDVVMLQWAFDIEVGYNVLDDARRFALGAPPFDLETAGLMLGRGPRPHPERIARAIGVLKRITALAPRSDRAPLFCILAWLNWALGRSSVANLFVTAAEGVDDGYGFAELMRTVLERGMLPEWAFVSDR